VIGEFHFYVYFHLKPGTSEVYYVGMGHGDRAHSVKVPRNPFWKAVYDKHGAEIRLIHEGLSKEEAFELERHYIKEIGRRDLGLGTLTNLTDGGEGLIGPSKETRKKMSESASVSGKRRFTSQAERDRAKESMRAVWNNLTDEERAKRLKNVQDAFTPEIGAKIAAKVKAYYEQDSNREAQSQRLKESWQKDSERKAAMSVRSSQYWANESNRKEQSSKMRQFYSDEANREATANYTRDQWKDPAIRKRRSDGIKRKYASDPEFRKKISESSKARWKKWREAKSK